MVLLVTGGAGFIGSNFVQHWLDKYPHDIVVCYDLLTYAGNIGNLSGVLGKSNFHFIQGDICNSSDVEQCIVNFGVDKVINFAAESHVDNSITCSQPFVRTNILGVHVLLELCVKHNIKLFYQISTDEVYGGVPLDGSIVCCEYSPLNPSSPYSASKASADLLVMSYHKTHNLPIVISRSCNNYGVHQHSEKFIPSIIGSIVARQPVKLYGDGTNKRNWLHVIDHCRAIDCIISSGVVGQIYNIGSANCMSNNALVDRILAVFGIDNRQLVCHVADRQGHDSWYNISSNKIATTLHWQEKVPFDSGLAEIVACDTKTVIKVI